MLLCGVVQVVQHRIGYLIGEHLLLTPALIEQLARGLDVPLLHCSRHVQGDPFRMIQSLFIAPLPEGSHLGVDDICRFACCAGVAENRSVLQLVYRVVFDPYAVYIHTVRSEFHKVEPAKDCGVLILLASGQAYVLSLERICQMSGLVARHVEIEPFGNCGYNGHHDRGGTAET
ncbi:hypothetical protein SDC9_124750 [bioreactor metagenome]|uniref:Uncharacterized protein n=1 Tax=bioreactor metagenome TaxID=1076179 RepID=A0A645CLT6_9ZZZZ